MLEMASDWDVVRQLGRWKWPTDPAQIQSFCAPFVGDGLLWTIKEDGVFAGRIGITHGELGYTLPKSAHGRGIATQACRHVITQAFDILDLDVIRGTTWFDNAASERVLHKVGFVQWQTQYDQSVARGLPVLVRRYRLTRSAWHRLSVAPK